MAKGLVLLLIGVLSLTSMRASTTTRYSLEKPEEEEQEEEEMKMGMEMGERSSSLSGYGERKLLGYPPSPPVPLRRPDLPPPPAAWKKKIKKKPPTPPPPPPPQRKKSPPNPSYRSATPRPNNGSLISRFLNPHNTARSRLGLPPLSWDPKLAKYADWWAHERSFHGNCQPKHSDTGGRYGENIFWGGGSSWTPEFAIQAFVDENKYYNYASNTCQKGRICGHYTQVVWRETKRVGCARVVCLNSETFISCNYEPPGNYIGERPY